MIARGSRSEARVVVVELEEKVLKAPVNARRIRVMEKVMPGNGANYERRAAIRERADTGELQKILPAGAARNALDCALWIWRRENSSNRWLI